MTGVPEIIYLQISEDGELPKDFSELTTTWCSDRINKSDIQYILAPQPKK